MAREAQRTALRALLGGEDMLCITLDWLLHKSGVTPRTNRKCQATATWINWQQKPDWSALNETDRRLIQLLASATLFRGL